MIARNILFQNQETDLIAENVQDAIEEIVAGGILTATGGASVIISTTEPAEANEGDLWWDNSDGVLYIYYDQGGNLLWVEVSYGDQQVIAQDVLTRDNTEEYTPTSDFHPATKKYVDDTAADLVTGPATSADNNIPLFDGTTGKLLKDGFSVQDTLSYSATALVRADAIVTALLSKADKLANVVTTENGFTVGIEDTDKVFVLTNTTAITINLPDDSVAVPIGTQMAFIRNGIGTVTFGGSGTILSDSGKKAIKTQYSSAAVIKTAEDTWQLVGNLIASS